ncbi:hypothetical protein [Streptomyces sp. CA-179760]|uniref:hypothetical protein n=1 Tax=Streptomyces sp. CA-179760 TaxID=3240054 RepID=UPI003D92F542
MNLIRDHITRAVAVTALVLGTVLAGLSVPTAADSPRNTTGTTVTASAEAGASDVGWQ